MLQMLKWYVCLYVIVVASLSCVGSLRAQDTNPIEEAVYLGQSKLVDQPDGVLAAPILSDESICRGERASERFLVITGKKIGTSSVTVIAADGKNAKVYKVTVKRDEAKFASIQNDINSMYKCSKIEIKIIDSTQDIIVTGRVEGREVIERIFNALESASVPRTDIIMNVKIPTCYYRCR